MFLDAVHITNKFAQHGDTLITSVTNMPEQMDVRVTDFPESINLAKDVSALRDSIDSISAQVTEIFNNGIGYPDSIQIWAMPIFIALFAMAVPLLIQHVNGLDGKYSATTISDAFKSDWVYLLFWITFAVTLVLFGIWVILFIGHPGTHSTMEKTLVTSAFLFLFAVVLMIIKLLIYSSPEKLKWFSKEMFKWWKSLKK